MSEEPVAAEQQYITLPDDIRAEIVDIDSRFSESADAAIHAEYEKIGALQFLKKVSIEDCDVFLFREREQNNSSLSVHPILGESGEIVAYDVYRVNQNAVGENTEAVSRIRDLSIKLESDIRTEKLKLLDAAVSEGRASDLGEMSGEEWAELADETLDESVAVHLYDAEGNRLNRMRVFRILN